MRLQSILDDHQKSESWEQVGLLQNMNIEEYRTETGQCCMTLSKATLLMMV